MSGAFALNNEYKNTLDKIEVIKTSADGYSINLYTSKNYSEPAKVIKKSDYSYYILLPETKNNVRSTATNADIASIDANSYNYASDTNNGYVKINITTTRPLNLKVNTQTAAAKSKVTVASAPQKTKTTEVVNLRKATQNQIAKSNSETIKTEKPKENIKIAINNPKNNSIRQTKEQLRSRQNRELYKKDTSVTSQKKKAYRQENLEKMKTKQELAKEIPAKLNLSVPSEIDKEEIEKTFNEWQNGDIEDVGEEIPIETVTEENSQETKTNIAQLKNLVKQNKTSVLLGLLAFMLLIILLIIPRKKAKHSQTQLKENVSQDKTVEVPTNPVGADVSLEEPIQTSYENKDISQQKPQLQGHFIPLKEESSQGSYGMKIEPYTGNIEPDVEETTSNALDETLEKPAQAQEQAQVQAQNSEPIVLSTAQIAQNRGFMCILYEGSARFMGYIGDEVFALHNFKKQELKNSAIKFRLAERTQTGATFIVKVDDTKLIIDVDKSSMKLEMAL